VNRFNVGLKGISCFRGAGGTIFLALRSLGGDSSLGSMLRWRGVCIAVENMFRESKFRVVEFLERVVNISPAPIAWRILSETKATTVRLRTIGAQLNTFCY
jgi:hypothetical protein